MKDLKKVVAYCRVSTDSKDQENSFENQQSYFRRNLCKENGFELIDIYADKGLTGTSFKNRTEFNKMLKDAGVIKKEEKANAGEIRGKYINVTYVPDPNLEPKFNYIYVKNSSRFARNIEVVQILRALKTQNVYVFFEDLNKSTESEADEMLLHFMFALDERESRDKSNKVKFGSLESAKKGRVRSCNLYGYKYSKEEQSLRIIEEEAEVVRLCFELRKEGYGGRVIANKLNEKGYKTRAGSEWRHNVVNRLLQNPTYMGKVARNRYDVNTMFGANTRVLKDKSEWIVQDTDLVDRIIDDETFEQVQRDIAKSRQCNISLGKYQGRSELSRKIMCMKCNSTYTRNKTTEQRKDGKHEKIFYNCSLKRTKGVKACNNPNAHETEINKLIDIYIGEGKYKKIANNFFAIFDKRVSEYIDELNASFNKDNKDIINKNNDKIEELNAKINKLLDLYIDGNIQKEMLDNKSSALKKEVEELEKINNNLSVSDEEIMSKIKKIKELREKAYIEITNIPDFVSRHDFIDKYLVKIYVKENGKLLLITRASALSIILKKIVDSISEGDKNWN